MEATTPPDTTGFSRKPTRRNRRTGRSRYTGYRKPHSTAMDAMPSEATAWLYGSMFLMAAARLLAPFMGKDTFSPHTTTSTAD